MSEYKLRTYTPAMGLIDYYSWTFPRTLPYLFLFFIVAMLATGALCVWINGILGGIGLVVSYTVIYAVCTTFLGDTNEEYKLWKEWYFSEFPGAYTDWLDREFITGKDKATYKKRKPCRKDLRQMVGSFEGEREQPVFDYWYNSEWREEYRDWLFDYLAIKVGTACEDI